MEHLKHLFTCLRKVFFSRLSFFVFVSWIAITWCMSPLSALPQTEINAGQEKLQKIHAHLELLHGSLLEEYPEQLMTTLFLSKEAKVLELGGNFGRNSCVIGSILEDSTNLVTVEPNPEYIPLLQANRDHNGLSFHIEPAAISKKPLVQTGWNSKPSAVDVPGFFRLQIISFADVQKKYNIEFDTLVVDCEGALYDMLLDDPEILTNITTIIIENDFTRLEHARYVHDLFLVRGFQLVYNEAAPDCVYSIVICPDNFYQVWQK